MIRSTFISVVRRPLILAALGALLVLTAVVLSAPRRVGAETTVVDGVITTDTTWTRANSPYIITTPVTVTAQATLTIEAGVEVRFTPATWLLINGGFNAQGTPEQQVRMTGASDQPWRGVNVFQPKADVQLRSVTVTNAQTGLAIQQQGGPVAQVGRVTVQDSLFQSNTVGIDADYSIITNAPRLVLRNNLLTNNVIGLQFNSLPGGNIKPKLNHNSFVGNSIGLRTLNITGKGLKAQQHWWGSADGPLVGDATTCANPPAPGTSTRDIVCGAVDFAPWAKVPAGRAIIGPEGGTLEGAAGMGVLSDDDTLPTSIVTLTVPMGAFDQPVDLLVSARAPAELPPVQPGLQPTALFLDISAAADGQAIHQFANGQSLEFDIAYLPQDLGGADPSRLVLYYWDETRQIWSFAGFSTSVDPANQRIHVRMEHLTRVGVMDVNLGRIGLPMVIR